MSFAERACYFEGCGSALRATSRGDFGKFSTVRYYLCAFFRGLDVWLVRLLAAPQAHADSFTYNYLDAVPGGTTSFTDVSPSLITTDESDLTPLSCSEFGAS